MSAAKPKPPAPRPVDTAPPPPRTWQVVGWMWRGSAPFLPGGPSLIGPVFESTGTTDPREWIRVGVTVEELPEVKALRPATLRPADLAGMVMAAIRAGGLPTSPYSPAQVRAVCQRWPTVGDMLKWPGLPGEAELRAHAHEPIWLFARMAAALRPRLDTPASDYPAEWRVPTWPPRMYEARSAGVREELPEVVPPPGPRRIPRTIATEIQRERLADDSLNRARCGQCGEKWSGPACGPTHAAERARRKPAGKKKGKGKR